MANTGHEKYGAVEFQRYHDGTMPAAERRLLEGAALEDPFLAEALEGYAFSSNGPADITGLKQQLKDRETGKNPRNGVFEVVPGWFRIAALFLLVVGSCWGVYRIWKSNDTGLAAIPASTLSSRAKDRVPSSTPSDTTPPAASSNDGVALQNKVAAPLALPTAVPKPTNRDRLETSLAAKTEGVKIDQSSTPSTVPSARVATQEISDEDVQRETVFKGKVVDSRGAPVPNVSITAATDKRVSTTTDANGNFSLKGNDSAFNATLSATGFNARQAFLAAPSQNTIVLKEASSSLNEVVVMARKRSAAGSVQKDASVRSDSMPVGGWPAFNSYVEAGRSTRKGIAGDVGPGSVVLSFETDKRGTPSKVKIEQSFCGPCDKEAVRVLTSGPKWKLAKGKRATVAIPFD
jgi:hypothetical protein